MNTNLLITSLAIIALLILLAFFWIVSTEKRLKRFFMGKKAKDLEETIGELSTEIEKLKRGHENAEKNIGVISAKLKKSIRGVETTRFNPFPDQGSNQSFAISLLNEEGDGLVLSSLYSRERMSIFAKPIKGGKPSYDLTEEEQNTMEKARAKIN